MAPERMAAILLALNQPCNFFIFYSALFLDHFIHNVAANISYDLKELLDIRTAITHLELDK